MDFKDQIKSLGDRVHGMKNQILTEEATKTALIMPFINTLGYDVFNPSEVVPEFIADIGIKKGEKVDYAILKDGQPIMLIECKHWSADLNPHNSQLFRYFHTTHARFGLLTNGICYKFYTDLIETNKMDEKPFFEFNIDQIKENQIEKLKEFHKGYFNVESITNTASELKHMNELRGLIVKEFSEPSDEFTRFFAKNVYPSMITAKVLEQFRTLLKKTISLHVNDIISERLNVAVVATQKEETEVAQTSSNEPVAENKVVTTQDEFEAFYIIRAILRNKVAVERVAYRDAQTYFSILLDNNNRKPICRLYLGGKKQVVVMFDGDNESKQEIQSLTDLYQLSERLIATVDKYTSGKVTLQDAERITE